MVKVGELTALDHLLLSKDLVSFDTVTHCFVLRTKCVLEGFFLWVELIFK
jgi:hypothetical protein